MPPSLVANLPRSTHDGHGAPIAPNASFCVAPGGHEPRWLNPDTRPSSWVNASAATSATVVPTMTDCPPETIKEVNVRG